MTALRLALIFVLSFGVDFWSPPTPRAAEFFENSEESEEGLQNQRVRRSVRLARQNPVRAAALQIRAASNQTLRDVAANSPSRVVGGALARKAPPPVRESSSALEDH